MNKAHVYNRDHINTDEIIPARYLNTDDEQELAKHCMEDLDKGFVGKVAQGDCVVAGEDFGCGSSREHAVWALRGAGVQTVIASLWLAADQQTADFMAIFYEHLNRAPNPVTALAQAQREAHRSGLAPYYWAPFCVFGKP